MLLAEKVEFAEVCNNILRLWVLQEGVVLPTASQQRKPKASGSEFLWRDLYP